MSKLILFMLITLLSLVCSYPLKKCNFNEIFRDCGSCERQCSNGNEPIFCTAVCREECQCKSGYVRQFITNNKKGPCIEKKFCPSKPKLCPLSCTKWFDGCNWCQCVNGNIKGCTNRYCPWCKNKIFCKSKCLQQKKRCPKKCKSWFDGCNKCKCVNGYITTCTMKYCGKKKKPKCMDNVVEYRKCPHKCSLWYDGCNNCGCKGDRVTWCTRLNCVRLDKPKCIRYNKEHYCPKECKLWFDGCNTCKCKKGKITSCTEKYCKRKLPSYCIDPVNICKLPMEIGQCRGAFPRYYYNFKLQKCLKFTYGGCQGNANNFRTIEECKKVCN